jgi:hypothetical protein
VNESLYNNFSIEPINIDKWRSALTLHVVGVTEETSGNFRIFDVGAKVGLRKILNPVKLCLYFIS